MAISLTCVCGAILEIDDKFRGQKIPCPDCNRLLDTTPPAPPPAETSGWALASLMLSLGGMLTLIGPIAGFVCGIVGIRQIARDPRLGGAKIARAGVICGGVFTLLSVWALFGTEFFNLDGFFRLYVSAGDLKFPPELAVTGPKLPGDVWIKLVRPSHAWGIRQDPQTDNAEELVLVNLWEDAHMLIASIRPEEQDKAEDCRREAIMAFLKTNLAKSLSKSTEPLPYPRPEQVKILSEDDRNPKQQDFIVYFPWGAIPRVFLFHVFPDRSRMNVAVGGARASRFDRLEEPLRKALEASRLEDVK